MSYRPKDFEAIIFDLGGVLLNLNYYATIKAFENLGMEDFDTYYSKAQQNHIFDDFETGKLSAASFRQYFRDTINAELSDECIDISWNAMLLDLPKARIDLLNKLKAEIPLFLFSNTNEIHISAFRKIIAESHGDANLLEGIFLKTYYSSEVGERKPNKTAFEKVLFENNLDPRRVLFIDDSEQHIEGAAKLGIQTHHLVNEDITTIFKFI